MRRIVLLPVGSGDNLGMKTSTAFLVAFLLSFSFLNSPLQAESASPSYRIGSDDVLNIYVWKEPELTQDTTVMSDGRISFPLIGEVMAQGQTVTQLRETITEKLRKFVTSPEITVIVRESRSRRIYTIGKLTRPGPYPLDPNMTVLQALATAGGFTEWADTKNILIVRKEGEKEIQLHFNYDAYIYGDKTQKDIVLKPQDTIVVP
jgi:polysaccharide export outer membrane protein